MFSCLLIDICFIANSVAMYLRLRCSDYSIYVWIVLLFVVVLRLAIVLGIVFVVS